MTKPNLDGKLRVLIIERKKNSVINDFKKALGDRFEFTTTYNLNKASMMIRSHELPYYSLVVFDSSVFESIGYESVEKKIMNIRHDDPLVPHLFYGKGNIQTFSAVARGGRYDLSGVTNIFYSKDVNDLQEKSKLIYVPPSPLKNLSVMKIGGSSFDYDRQTKKLSLSYLCRTLVKIFKGNLSQECNIRKIILTAGAGPFGDIAKTTYKIYRDENFSRKLFSEQMVTSLQRNLEFIEVLLGKENCLLAELGFFEEIIEENAAEKILLVGIAPHHILARDNISLQDSDTHTIALAEFYGAEKVVLVKRTDGIYSHDPYLGFVLDPITKRCKSMEAWKEAQKNNRRHSIASVDDLLIGNVSRIGTNFDLGEFDGSTGHLTEDSALEYFKYCSKVKEIIIVHIAPEEMHYQTAENAYKHVVTGETIQLGSDGWKGVLEQKLRDAFEGRALSKIVR